MDNIIYPSVGYPTIIEGVVYGNRLRVESLDGDSALLLSYLKPLGWEVIRWGNLMYRDGAFRIKNLGPFVMNGKLWGVTHLQKYSPCGYLKVEPDCYHRWHFWRPQAMDANLNWIPGSEQGIYLRKSRKLFQLKCWRWDVAGTLIDGVLRHWIRSGGYFGGHWD
jgi:hypothetical protein